MNKLEPLKQKKSEAPASMDPLDAYYDERGDEDWDEKDLEKLVRPGHGKDRNQASTSGHPKDAEK